MVSQTTLSTDAIKLTTKLTRFLSNRLVVVTHPYDVHSTTLESYFKLSDDDFIKLRDRY